MFLREHNRVARELALVNTVWSDETLFQETRKIVAGMLQHIVYDFYVPSVLGFQGSEKYGILTVKSGYFTGYDTTVRFI